MTDFQDKAHFKTCDNCGSIFYRDKRNTYKYWKKARFCSRSCSNECTIKEKNLRRGTLTDVFWSKVKKRNEEDCWDWTGTKDRDGYGILSFNKRQMRANRVAITVSGRKLLHGHYACHSCGNSWCVNPSHIYSGTPKENATDKIKHGTNKYGSICPTSKLKESDIILIRLDRRTNREIANQYGVSPSNISFIKTRKTWKRVI